MNGKHFYPDIIAEFVVWGANFVIRAQDYAAALNIPAEEISSLLNAWTLFLDAQNVADAPTLRTSFSIAEARRLRKLAVQAMSRIKNGYIDPGFKMKKIDAPEYHTFGLQLPDNNHTPKRDPTDHVDFQFDIDAESHRVLVRYRIEGDTKWGKGTYHGVEIRYWVRALADLPPANVEEAGWRGEIHTASPWYKDLLDDAGKHIWVAMRWINRSTGKDGKRGKGPWSAIKSAIVS
jgi:hypothetical protein